jgi:hypothetical protein
MREEWEGGLARIDGGGNTAREQFQPRPDAEQSDDRCRHIANKRRFPSRRMKAGTMTPALKSL